MPSPFGIATLSLGDASVHSLESKLQAASLAGFESVEMFVPDWEAYVKATCGKDAASDYQQVPVSDVLAAARTLHAMLSDLNLSVSCIQPLRDMEGRTDPADRQAARNLLLHYLPIADIFKTDLLLICSSCRPDSNNSFDQIAADLAEMANIAATWCEQKGARPIRIGFEALSWGTHVNTWSQAWECVQKGNRPNLGLVLDSFNFCAREICDPYTPTGLQRSPSQSQAFLNSRLEELVATVPGDKIFLFQVADAALPPSSFKPPIDPLIPRLRPWSRAYRLFPLEGYLPTREFYDAVVATGYKGPLSLEVFNSSLSDPSPSTPQQHAMRGIAGLRKLTSQSTSTLLYSASASCGTNKRDSGTLETWIAVTSGS